MSFQDLENSVDDSRPIEVYKIVSGLNRHLYTSSNTDVSFLNETYIPEVISSGKISETGDYKKDALSITINKNNEFVKSFVAGNIDNKASLLIYRLQGSFYAQLWGGEITSVTIGSNNATIKSEPSTMELENNQLTARYQENCRFILYSEGCRINSEAYKAIATLSSVLGNTLTSSDFATKPDGYFKSGYIEYENYKRLIIDHVGNTITLEYRLFGLSTGSEIAAYAGCRHNQEDCKNKFDNFANYGGFNLFSQKNPYTGE